MRHRTDKNSKIQNVLFTSYFAKIQRDGLEEKCFAISRSTPPSYRGLKYSVLFPSAELLCVYRNVSALGWERFSAWYHKETLSKLDPVKVLADVGVESILVCWEGPNKFCHRHIVADWLMANIKGLEVVEL